MIDFRDAPVFNGVIAYASILIGQKQRAPDSHAVSALPWDLDQKAETLPDEIHKAFPVAQNSLTEDGWRLVSPEVDALLTKLRKKGTPLGEYVEGRFYYGIKTGFNEAFVIDGKKRAELIDADPKSEKIIKPFLRGRDVKRWKATQADLWIIFTRRGIDIDAYPAIKTHLEKYREQLEPKPKNWKGKKWQGRKGGSYHWYEIQDNIAYWQEFEQPKIILGRFMNSPLYSMDLGEFYISNASSVISGQGAELCSILNSNPCWWFLTSTTTDLQNGYLQAHNNNHSPLPIPPVSKTDKTALTTLAEKCALAAAKNDQATLTVHEAEINQIVYRLFDLTTAEIQLIETSLGIDTSIIPFPKEIPARPLLAIPTTRRTSYTNQELVQIIYLREFIALRGKESSLKLFSETLNYLINPETYLTAKSCPITQNEHHQWKKSFASTNQQGVFALVGKLEEGEEIVVNRETLVITLTPDSTLIETPNDEWICYDLELAHATLAAQSMLSDLLTQPESVAEAEELLLEFAIA